MAIKVLISYDNEAHVWIAENDTIGLILESDSYDRLIEKARNAIPELIALNHISGYESVAYTTAPYTEKLASNG